MKFNGRRLLHTSPQRGRAFPKCNSDTCQSVDRTSAIIGDVQALVVHIDCDVAFADPNLRSAVITLFIQGN
jgi:hypothetical protein